MESLKWPEKESNQPNTYPTQIDDPIQLTSQSNPPQNLPDSSPPNLVIENPNPPSKNILKPYCCLHPQKTHHDPSFSDSRSSNS